MLRRLRIYFTGFAIGLVMVYFFFGNDESRDLDIWMPDQRILEDIRNDSILQNGNRMKCFQECLGMSDSTLLSLWTNADSKSTNPGGNPYIYLITLKTETDHFQAEVERYEDKTQKLIFIRNLQQPSNCICEQD